MDNVPARRRALRAAFATMLSVAVVPGYAGSVGGNGGSTEATQLMNHAELVLSYGKQVESVMTQIQQYLIMLQNIKQGNIAGIVMLGGKALDAAKVAATEAGVELPDMSGGMTQADWQKVAETTQTYANLYGMASRLNNSLQTIGWQAESVANSSGRLNMTPTQYLWQLNQVAQQQGGYYQKQLQGYQTQIDQTQRQLAQTIAYANSIPNIDGNVKGLQVLAAGQANVQAALGNMQGTLIAIQQNQAVSAATAAGKEATSTQALQAIQADVARMGRMNGQPAPASAPAPGATK